MLVHVIRDDPKRGTHVERPHLTPRQAFRLKRDVVYTLRNMRLYGLRWVVVPSLVGLRKWKLVVANLEAEATDAGLMSFCRVMVDGATRRPRRAEEEFAGYGGFNIAVLRGTQHVIELMEEQAKLAEETMDAT